MKVNKDMINQLSNAKAFSNGTSLITMYLPGDYNF